MPKKITLEEAVSCIEQIQKDLVSYKAGTAPEGFIYREAVQELMRLKRGLSVRRGALARKGSSAKEED